MIVCSMIIAVVFQQHPARYIHTLIYSVDTILYICNYDFSVFLQARDRKASCKYNYMYCVLSKHALSYMYIYLYNVKYSTYIHARVLCIYVQCHVCTTCKCVGSIYSSTRMQ